MKRFKKSILALGLMIFMQAIVPPQSKAFILIAPDPGGMDIGAGNLTPYLCILFLPLCLLSEKNSAMTTTDINFLKENGYTDSEIEILHKDQSVLVENLKAENKAIKIGAQDNREIIAAEIKNLYPEVSDTYVDFFLNTSGLNH